MKPTTRLRILDHFRKNQTASALDLSRALAMTAANVRHHLAILESNDLIEVIGIRREGRGRPRQVYGLSRRVLGDGLDELAAAMLDVWLDAGKADGRAAGLMSVAERLAGEKRSGDTNGASRRLALGVERLNELHYQARWEAGAGGPRLILGHCPYAAIIAAHPELCDMDELLMEELIGSPVEQTAKLQAGVNGLPFCNFQVKGKR